MKHRQFQASNYHNLLIIDNKEDYFIVKYDHNPDCCTLQLHISYASLFFCGDHEIGSVLKAKYTVDVIQDGGVFNITKPFKFKNISDQKCIMTEKSLKSLYNETFEK